MGISGRTNFDAAMIASQSPFTQPSPLRQTAVACTGSGLFRMNQYNVKFAGTMGAYLQGLLDISGF